MISPQELNTKYLETIEHFLEDLCKAEGIEIKNIKDRIKVQMFCKTEKLHFLDRKLVETTEIFLDDKKIFVVELHVDNVVTYGIEENK